MMNVSLCLIIWFIFAVVCRKANFLIAKRKNKAIKFLE